MFFYGPISDKIGRRKVVLFGLSVYLICSLLITETSSISGFLVLRLIQGIGAGVGPTLAIVIIMEYFSKDRVGKIISICSLVFLSSPLFVPFIGGYIQEHLGWQYNFLFLTVLAAIALITYYFCCPETNLKFSTEKLSIIKALQIYWNIFKDNISRTCLFAMAFVYSTYMVFPTLGPFLYQIEYKFSPVHFGILCLVISLGAIPSKLLYPSISKRFSHRALFYCGATLILLSSVALFVCAMFFAINPYMIVLLIACVTFSANIFTPILTTSALLRFESNKGAAGSLYSGLAMMMTAGIIALLSHLPDDTPVYLSSAYFILAISIFCLSLCYFKLSD